MKELSTSENGRRGARGGGVGCSYLGGGGSSSMMNVGTGLIMISSSLATSAAEMAKLLKLEISYTAVSAYELETREPDLLTLLQYARVAGVSTDVLIDDRLNLPRS